MAGTDKTADAPTGKAVVAEAKRLRERADREVAADPYARPYRPSDRLAWQLASQLGPEAAIAELKQRATEAAIQYREDNERSDRARARLDRQQRTSDAELRHRRAGMSLGQRLDEALGALVTVSEVKAVSLEAPVSSGKPGSGSPDTRVNDPVGRLRERAVRLVADMEDEIPRARQRLE